MVAWPGAGLAGPGRPGRAGLLQHLGPLYSRGPKVYDRLLISSSPKTLQLCAIIPRFIISLGGLTNILELTSNTLGLLEEPFVLRPSLQKSTRTSLV